MCVRPFVRSFVRSHVFRSIFGPQNSRFPVDGAIWAVKKGVPSVTFRYARSLGISIGQENDDHVTSDVSTHDNYTWPV